MATVAARMKIGPADHDRRMTLDEFIAAEFQEGWLYELGRGVVDVVEVPGFRHGRIIWRMSLLFAAFELAHPGVIKYRAGGGECRLRLPGKQSDRHPDQAVYLDPRPRGKRIWTRWVPHIVVEVLSPGGEHRDLVEKREEYLRAGVREYRIIDPHARTMTVLSRAGDVWEEQRVLPGQVHRTYLLPGLEVRLEELLSPEGEDDED